MTVSISIYDFFAYTIPGFVYLFIIDQINSYFKFVNVSFDHENLLHLISLIGLAYIAGILFEFIGRKTWYKWLKGEYLNIRAFKSVESIHENYSIDFPPNHWPTLYNFIRVRYPELGSDITKLNVMNLMLRNLSFSFLLYFIFHIVLIIIDQQPLLHLVLGIFILIFSIISLKESYRFGQMFYENIFETIIAEKISVKGMVEEVAKNRKNKRRKDDH